MEALSLQSGPLKGGLRIILVQMESFIQIIMLIKRNTPDPVTKFSSAEIIFGRKLSESTRRKISS